jgi:hypothetical protein
MTVLTELSTARLVSDADHVELSRLVTELAWRIDAGLASTAYELFAPELFAPDGEIHIGPVDAVGIEAIKAWGKRLDEENALPGIHHAVTNLRFVDDGGDRAYGTSLLTAYFVSAGEPNTTAPFAVGEDHDSFVHTDQGWRFASRTWVQLFSR